MQSRNGLFLQNMTLLGDFYYIGLVEKSYGLPHFEQKRNSTLFVKILHGQKGSITGLKQL